LLRAHAYSQELSEPWHIVVSVIFKVFLTLTQHIFFLNQFIFPHVSEEPLKNSWKLLIATHSYFLCTLALMTAKGEDLIAK
jgi:hypothetical protein